MSKGYSHDLSYIHDVGHGDFARNAATGLLGLLRDAGIHDGLVVDLGCGSGIWAAELCRAGYDVLGIDISAGMLEIARARAPQARFRRGSFMTTRIPPCRAVTAIGEIFNYCFDGESSAGVLQPVFERVHAALAPGGLFVFDVAEPGRGAGPALRHRLGDDWAVLVRVEEDPHGCTLARNITSFRRHGQQYRRTDETHKLRLYRGAELATLLRRAGFRTRTVRGYGKFRFWPHCVGLVARKPAAGAVRGVLAR